jgi:hypothetical protein
MKIFQATEWQPTTAHGETVGLIVSSNPAPERGERDFMRSIFCRASGALALLLGLLCTFAAKAETTNVLSNAEIKGRELARQLAEAKPAQNLTNTCVMQIRNGKNRRTIPLLFQTTIGAGSWTATYKTLTESNRQTLVVIHSDHQPTRYQLISEDSSATSPPADLNESEITTAFAGSDFWLCDLGLEFLHWPAQKLLPKTTNLKRGRSYTLLESTNPNPPTNGYSRVLSWIDQESGGLLQAEAYDAQGKKLKIFEPKNFEKVNGQWQLEEIQIRNDQTGSNTRLEFDLKQ